MSPIVLSGRERLAQSRYVFEWRARDGSVDALTGQVGTHVRAGIGFTLDQNGRYVQLANNVPRFGNHMLGGDFGLCMDGGDSVNLVVQSDALGTGWTTVGAPTIVNAYGTYAGRPFSRVTGIGVGTEVRRVVTLTGNTKKGFEILVASDGANGTMLCGMYDATALGWKCQVTVTVTGSVVTAVAGVGTLAGVEPLADGVYRIRASSQTMTAANTNHVYAVNGSGGTLTGVRVSQVRVTDTPYVPPGLNPTAGATVTAKADALQWTLNVPHVPLTLYAEATCLITEFDSGTNFELVSKDSGGGTPYLAIRRDGGTLGMTGQYGFGGNFSSPTNGSVAYGQRFEARAALSPSNGLARVTLGTAQPGGVTETSSYQEVATYQASWPNALLKLFGTSQVGYWMYHRIVVALGSPTMDQLASRA